MASIKPHIDGWRAFIFKQGVRKSKVFLSKAAASTWAKIQETEVKYDAVLHGWHLIDHARTIAIKEWGWLTNNLPKDMRQPKHLQLGSRHIYGNELERSLDALGDAPCPAR